MAIIERTSMKPDSRKAQHNSFAHHRADLIFAPRPMAETPAQRRPDLPGVPLRQLVRASLLGPSLAQASPL